MGRSKKCREKNVGFTVDKMSVMPIIVFMKCRVWKLYRVSGFRFIPNRILREPPPDPDAKQKHFLKGYFMELHEIVSKAVLMAEDANNLLAEHERQACRIQLASLANFLTVELLLLPSEDPNVEQPAAEQVATPSAEAVRPSPEAEHDAGKSPSPASSAGDETVVDDKGQAADAKRPYSDMGDNPRLDKGDQEEGGKNDKL